MTLTSALLEIATRWDTELARHLDAPTRETLARQLSDGLDTASVRPFAQAIHTVARAVPDDVAILAALERPTVRRSRPHELSHGHIVVREHPPSDRLGAHLHDLPVYRYPNGERVLSPSAPNDETFLAAVLQDRLSDHGQAAAIRVAARQTTVRGFSDRSSNDAAFVAVAPPGDRLAPELPLAAESVLGFDPVELFLELPERLRSTLSLRALRVSAVIAPAFQVAHDRGAAAKGDVVGEANRLLDAAHDPWGVGSWWIAPNAWLGTSPIDLLGSDREPAIVQAARELTSGAW